MPTKNFNSWIRKQRIGVLMGGASAERPISLKTGEAILASLKRQGLRAVAIDPTSKLPQQLLAKKISFAFIALHGPGGEDGTVQGLLEWMKIPYTGSGVLSSSIAMDKSATKRVFNSADLPTPKWTSVHRSSKIPFSRLGIPLPCVIKPATQGSAIGISIVKKQSEIAPAFKIAFSFDPVVLVEEFIAGPEITVGVIGEQVLPVIEIVPDSSRPFYDFKAKYAPGGSRHLLPARLPARVQKTAQSLALRACEALSIRGAARVDMMIHPKRGPLLLEVNTVPGMTETSLLPEAAQAAGLSFDALTYRIMELSS